MNTFFLAGALVAAAVCVRLGLWQRSRLHERRAANATIEAARALPPVRLPTAAAAPAGPLRHRRLVATGRYDRRDEFLLGNQAYLGQPGVHVITPLRLAGTDTVLLVDRGFAPAPDGSHVPGLDALETPDSTTVAGVAIPLPEARDGGRPRTVEGRLVLQNLDLSAIRSRLPFPVFDVLLLEHPDATRPRIPRPVDPRPLDDGPHLSYMLQWFAFAAIAVVGGLIVALRRRAPGSSASTGGAPAAGGPPPAPPGPAP